MIIRVMCFINDLKCLSHYLNPSNSDITTDHLSCYIDVSNTISYSMMTATKETEDKSKTNVRFVLSDNRLGNCVRLWCRNID